MNTVKDKVKTKCILAGGGDRTQDPLIDSPAHRHWTNPPLCTAKMMHMKVCP